jgi:hypothetical protein
MKTWFGVGWAQPVVSRLWALAATVLFALSSLTGHRVLNHAKHRAWEHAVGVGVA